MVTIPRRTVLPWTYRAVSVSPQVRAAGRSLAEQVWPAVLRTLQIIERLIVALVQVAIRIPGEAWLFVGVPGVAIVYCAVEAVLGYVADTRTWEQIGGTLLGGLLICLVIVAVVGYVVLRARAGGHSHGHARVVRRGRRVEFHTAPTQKARPGNANLKVAANHEAAHAVVAKHCGWRVDGVQINPDGSGVTRVSTSLWSGGGKPQDIIAVALAGGKGSNWSGCSSDLDRARETYEGCDPTERDAIWNEGDRKANSGLFWRGGEKSRIATKLLKDGEA
jgi:hypothetical protein